MRAKSSMMHRRIASAVLTGVVVSMALPMSAMAGKPHLRNGWMVGGGVGLGPASFTLADGSASSTETGGALHLRLGRAVNRNVTISIEIESWLRTETNDFGDEVTFTFLNFATAATYYPSETSGLYFRGGLGVANADVDVALGNARVPLGNAPVSLSEDGLGLLISGGYEFRLTRTFALGVGVGYDFLLIDGEAFDSARFGFGVVEANWYWGTSKTTPF